MPNSPSAVVRPVLTRRRMTNDVLWASESTNVWAAFGRSVVTPSRSVASSSTAGRSTGSTLESLESRTHLSVSKDDDGFTVVTPENGSRVIYVSASGSDSNPGTSSQPVKSLSKGVGMLRSGTGDQLLLKAGDTFSGTLGFFSKSGKSASEPLVIGTYGSGSRPVVNTGSSYALSIGTKTGVNNLVVQGIKFVSNGTAVADGISIFGKTNNLLFENIEVTKYVNNISLQKFFGPVTNITIRRSVITDAFSRAGRNSEGLFAEAVDNLTLEENVFDHNGWGNGGAQTVFNHNAYIRSTSSGFVARGNVFSNASSHGLQARAGGIIENNVFINNAIGLSFGLVNGSPIKPGGVSGRVLNNVFVGTRNIGSLVRGVGLEVGNIKAGGTSIAGNIFTSGNPNAKLPAIQLAVGSNVENMSLAVGINDLTLSNNIVYSWSMGLWVVAGQAPGSGPKALNNLKIQNNHFQKIATPISILRGSPFGDYSGNMYTNLVYNKYYSNSGGSNVQVNYVDANRTPGKMVGGTNDSYVLAARSLSKASWKTNLIAESVVTYMKSGFAVTGTVALRRK